MSGKTRRHRSPVVARTLWFVFASLLLGSPTAANATVMEPLTIRQLVAGATDVVEGEVERLQVVVGQRGDLWTEATLRVTRVHSGYTLPGVSIRVRHLGGERGRRGLKVAGTAKLALGERVVTFLRTLGDHFVTVGMCQGKYAVYRDHAGVEHARRDLSGASFKAVPRPGEVVIQPTLRLVGDPTPTLVQLRHSIAHAVDALGVKGGGR